MKAHSVLDAIGNTPHIRLSRLFPDADVWVKSERSNPGGSIKDRIALAMIEAAEAHFFPEAGHYVLEDALAEVLPPIERFLPTTGTTP